MRINRKWALVLAWVVVAMAAPGQAQAQAPAAPPPAAAEESSVRPGVNEAYLRDDVDVSQWVERFEAEGREIYEHRLRIVRAAQVKPGMTVADIGAGTGLFVPLFSQAAGPDGQVVAVDIVKEFLDHIKRRCQDAGIRNVRTVLCTERSVELPAGSIDLAFLCDVYHHLEYPRSTLTSIHQALKPGGELVLVEFKRIPGESSDWVLGHVRAGQEVFTSEIVTAGFRQVAAPDFLESNYVVRFKRVGK